MEITRNLAPDKAYLGKPVLRTEDERLLTGTGRFVDDIKLPGMAHAAVLRSPVAHGKIVSIDAGAALELPGVLAVYTATDLEGHAHHIPLSEAWTMPGLDRFRQWPIARDVVRYVGEPVVFIVAESRAIAEDACDLIELDIEEYDAVTNIDQSLLDETIVHQDAGTNLACNYTVNRGDVSEAFADPHYVRKEVFRIHRHTGMPLETRGIVAKWDPDAETLTCWGANKRPRAFRDVLASMLRIPPSNVTAIEVDVGGNFGTRGHLYPEDLLSAFASLRLKRPVKYIEDRREHFMATNHSREMSCELEIAVSKKGRIEGLRGRVFCDLGAYAGGPGAAVVPAKAVQFISGPYDIPNYQCELSIVSTNKTPIGAFRGPGRYEGAFFIERMVDIAANELGIDPLEFRRLNLIREAQMPYNGGVLVPYLGESPYDSGDYSQTLDRAVEILDYPALKQMSGKLIDGKLHGVAVCCYVDSTGMGPSEDARIVVEGPSTIKVYVGSSANGQGIQTVMAQVAADTLGVPMEWIQVYQGSTHYVERGNGHGHSRCAVMGGNAVHLAANNLKKKLLNMTALRLNDSPENLRYEGGEIIRANGAKPETIPFNQAVALLTIGSEATDQLQSYGRFENSALTYSYGAQAAHVTVDPETGTVEVKRFLTVEDVGRAINPMIVHGQSIGGAVQGISGTLLDQFIYDSSGQLLTASFADYLVASSTDFPNIEAETMENAKSTSNPLGIKGAGEGSISTTGAVIASAVSDALRNLGVEITDLPITPNKLFQLIRDAKNKSNIQREETVPTFGIKHLIE